MDETTHSTWITNLIAGTISAEEQAMREKFRTMAATSNGRHAGTERPVAAAYDGRHTHDAGDRLTAVRMPAGQSGINGYTGTGCVTGTLTELGL